MQKNTKKTKRLPGGVNRRKGQDTSPSTPNDDDEAPVAALDVEWGGDPANPMANKILAYGWRLEYRGQSKTQIFYPLGSDKRSRLNFGTMLSTLISRSIPEVLPDIPENLVVVFHYGRGDLAACKDFAVLKRQVDNVKGRFVSSRGAVKVRMEVDPKNGVPLDLLPRVPEQRKIKISDGVRSRYVNVTFRDTSLLVVEGIKGSLDAIGELVGVPKVELPAGYEKARMDLFLRDRRSAFEAYLARDLEIPILYYRRIKALMAELGLAAVPPTLGAAAIALFRMGLDGQVGADGQPLTHERLFGVAHQKSKKWSGASARYHTVPTTSMVQARRRNETLFADSYRGARTETYETGPSRPGEIVHDIDEKNAYPSGMVSVGVPDYEASFTTTDPSDFTATVLGAAEVEFSTPAHILFPVFPNSTDHGLVFARAGVAVVTAPEVATAVHLGVDFRIRHGVVIPWTKDKALPFLGFVRAMIEARTRRKKEEIAADGTRTFADTLESLGIKTIANALYGKISQGVHGRNVFDSRSGTFRPLSPSSVSNAAFAAYITGLARASLAEIMNGVPAGRRVISASTDGITATATIEEIGVPGPACRVLSENRRRITDGDASFLEYKKHALQVVTARSRAVFTAVVAPGSKPILAKASVKVPVDVADQNDFMLRLFLDRTKDTRSPRKDLVSFTVQWIGNTDLVSVERNPRINLEPDHKRKLVDPRMERIPGGPYAGREHLATGSEPHETVEAMIEQRTLFEGWRHTSGRCLKDMDDWDNWADYRDSTIAARAAGKRPYRTAGGSSDDLKRQFLRAFVRGEWGVGIGRQSYREVADWLSDAGYQTSADAVKNMIRPAARLIEHSIAKTDKTVELLAVILDTHPGFEFWHAFVSGHVDKLRADPRIARRLHRQTKAAG